MINYIFYRSPIWACVVLLFTYLNITFILDGDIIQGVLLQLMHGIWLLSLIKNGYWKEWPVLRLLVKDNEAYNKP